MGLKRKVLVVDDDRLMCWSLERALKGDGYDVSVSLTGEDAIEKLEKCDFDMVITDLKMAGMNGLAVLERVKSLCPSAKSVLMTAFGSDRIARQAEQKGACYVAKPFQIEDFVMNVRRLFDH